MRCFDRSKFADCCVCGVYIYVEYMLGSWAVASPSHIVRLANRNLNASAINRRADSWLVDRATIHPQVPPSAHLYYELHIISRGHARLVCICLGPRERRGKSIEPNRRRHDFTARLRARAQNQPVPYRISHKTRAHHLIHSCACTAVAASVSGVSECVFVCAADTDLYIQIVVLCQHKRARASVRLHNLLRQQFIDACSPVLACAAASTHLNYARHPKCVCAVESQHKYFIPSRRWLARCKSTDRRSPPQIQSAVRGERECVECVCNYRFVCARTSGSHVALPRAACCVRHDRQTTTTTMTVRDRARDFKAKNVIYARREHKLTGSRAGCKSVEYE